MKLSKTQLHKIGQSVGFLGRLLGPLLNAVLPLMKNILEPFAESVLVPLGLTAAASATDAITTLIIFTEEINDIMKMISVP